jgi:hypothetical protein
MAGDIVADGGRAVGRGAISVNEVVVVVVVVVVGAVAVFAVIAVVVDGFDNTDLASVDERKLGNGNPNGMG